MRHRWISSTGWLVFGSRQLLHVWPSESAGEMLATVNESAVVWRYGTYSCIILNDEPLDTAVIEIPMGIAFVRWSAAEDENAMLRAARRTLNEIRAVRIGTLEVTRDEHLLFDAAMGGNVDEPYQPMPVSLNAGRYLVQTARVTAGADGEVIALTHVLA